jgi:Mg2+ and Co2+ transporter CorA
VNNNLSLIMKRLTGITVVFAGLGAFAGIFGMSEAGAAFARTEATGFWLVTASIVALSLLIFAILRRIDWI